MLLIYLDFRLINKILLAQLNQFLWVVEPNSGSCALNLSGVICVQSTATEIKLPFFAA